MLWSLKDEGARMTDEKSKFDIDDGYRGPERRVLQRRSGHDRRDMIRFEPGKEDRRSGKDRRRPKSVWDDKRYRI